MTTSPLKLFVLLVTEQQHRTMNDKERNDYLESRETEILAFHSKVRTNNVLREVWDEARKEGREERLIEVLHWLRATRYYGRVAELADQLEETMRPSE